MIRSVKKKILISNDDGIHSEGIKALAKAMKPLGEVYVVAPDRERSASSHSLTLYHPLRVEEVAKNWYSVDGTPTDCVNLAINGILKMRPDLVVAGINKGPNMGDDITYSGTVSVAMEGTLLGVPSIALSVNAKKDFNFKPAADFANRLAKFVLENGLHKDTLLNVNVPNLDGDEISRSRRSATASWEPLHSG
ncbi:MAG: 5'/3'-nucleotidase SurE [Deltaproteobacteria bacterium]|nr:5'/3'-nucleotidase SurE [Deltaproteobacteria bacterium]